MRTFAISDIHGNHEAFQKALKEINFSKDDKLILLGDLIDRGSNSKGVLDTVISLKHNGYNVTCLIGNHERMLLDASFDSEALNQWLVNGGDKTLLSFHVDSPDKIPSEYFDLIRSFIYVLETEDHIFVHVALNMKIKNPSSDIYTLLWERAPLKFLDKKYLGNRRLIHGHTPHTKTEILSIIKNNKQVICIDNGAFANIQGYGSICVLQLEDLEVNFVS